MAYQSKWRTDADHKRAGDLRERLNPIDFTGVPPELHDYHRRKTREREPAIDRSDLREVGKAVLREAIAGSGDDDVLILGTSKIRSK